MFLLGKIFIWLLLSPGLFMILLFLVLKAALSNRRRGCIFLLILTCSVIYFLSVKPGRDLLIQPLETKYSAIQNPRIDSLIVLGGGGDASLQRLYAAYKIYRKNPVPIIVCGGDPLGKDTNDSAVMAAVLESWQVPRSKIIQENRSRNTQENLEFAKDCLRKNKLQKPGLVTDAIHMPRAIQIAQNLKIPAVPLPCDQKYEGNVYVWYDIFPNTGYLKDSFAGLKEYTGMFYLVCLVYLQKIL